MRPPARIAGEYLTQEMGLSFGNQVNSFGDGMEGPLTMIFEMVAAMITKAAVLMCFISGTPVVEYNSKKWKAGPTARRLPLKKKLS